MNKIEEFILKSKQLHGDCYIYDKVQYSGVHKKVKIVCKLHGPFLQTPNSHLRQKSGCPKCAGRKRLTSDEFIQKAKIIHGNRYNYSLVKYINNDTKIKIICKLHGPFLQTPRNHVVQRSNCPLCTGHPRFTTNDFIKNANIIHNNKYDYSLVQYTNMTTKIIIKCKDHGEFSQTPTAHIHSKTGCPTCNRSKGEETIENFLVLHNIEYIPQYAPRGLYGKNSSKSHLRYDFFIPIFNLLIEFDGLQHEQFKKKFHKTQEGFKDQQDRDKKKTNFAIDNEIELLRIKYAQMSQIDKILEQYLL